MTTIETRTKISAQVRRASSIRKVRRSYRCDKPGPHSLAELQFQLDAFREYYNSRRPHRALSRQTPLAVLNSLIKARPTQQPAATDHRVRRDRIDSFDKVTLRYLGRLRHIPVGTAHKNRKVRLLVAGPDVRILTDDGELIRALTVDPAATTSHSGDVGQCTMSRHRRELLS